MAWNPFGVMLEISATAATVTRISATQFTVKINVAWETYYSGAQTKYGMSASSGGATVTITPAGNNSSSGSGTLTGTYSISGNAAATKTVGVEFKNFSDTGAQATKTIITNSFTVPAWTSYTVSYNANGGTGAPSSQTKWKNQTLTLSSTNPTRTGYTFQGWATSASGSVAYAAGASYTANAAATLYAVWKANTYTVKFDANGGTGAPANQTKTYGATLTLSSTKPTRTNYNFLGWGTSASATTVSYAAGASYTANAGITLYAVWELAYTKPRITNYSAVRGTYDGSTFAEDSSGAYIRVMFSYECDAQNIEYEVNITDSNGNEANVLHVYGVREPSKDVVLYRDISAISSTEASYTVSIWVGDGIDSTEVYTTLNGEAYTVDFLAGGKGVAFGKPAELEGVADFAFDAKFNKPVYGKALGMDRLPAIPANSDFNNYMETGCYAVQSNAVAETIANIPVARAGRLEVWAATGEGVRAEQWSYLRQRFIPYNSTNAVWERELTRGEDNVWHYYDWWQSSLTPEAAQRVYSKAAMTAAIGSNTTLSTANAYTAISLNTVALSTSNRLTLSSGSIRIGAGIEYIKVSGQVLLKCGATTGNRHVRIQRTVPGMQTTYISWTCITGTASSNTLFTLTPVIASVQEGDLIKLAYYTSDTADYAASGSAANGFQTYLTVEEL